MKERFYGITGESGEGPRLDIDIYKESIEAAPPIVNQHLIPVDCTDDELEANIGRARDILFGLLQLKRKRGGKLVYVDKALTQAEYEQFKEFWNKTHAH